jgi:hypothetical protein
MNCKMTIYFGEILFRVSMSIYINHFHLGGGGGGERGVCKIFGFWCSQYVPQYVPYSNHSNNPFYCEARLINQVIEEIRTSIIGL